MLVLGKRRPQTCSRLPRQPRPSPGPLWVLGMDLRLESERLVGFALEHEGRIVHICLFPNAGSRKADDSSRMVRHSSRRQRRGL